MNSYKGLVGLLVILAIVIGAVVFLGMKNPSSWFSGGAMNGSQTETGTPNPSQNSGTASTTTVQLTGLSATETKLLTPPPATAPLPEQQTYADFVNKNAVDTTSLSVGAGCKLSPV